MWGLTPYGVGFTLLRLWYLLSSPFGCVIYEAKLVVLWHGAGHCVLVLGALRKESSVYTGQLLSMLGPGPPGRSYRVICGTAAFAELRGTWEELCCKP